MLFSDHPRTIYQNAPAHEVICQLRFPTILSINNTEPAGFQEEIRDTFPQYARRQDAPPPGAGPDQKPVTNYHFLSEDGRWKLNLTQDFIALSTLRYPGWEEFAHYLDRPLAAFIRLYRPAYFQRVGLRYINIFSRQRLGLEDVPWRELLSPAYTGPLQEEDAREEDFLNWNCELSLRLGSSCKAKVRGGLGRLQAKNAPQAAEVQFILDLDLSMGDNVGCTLAAGALETLHLHGGRVFEGALSDRLRQAMDTCDPA